MSNISIEGATVEQLRQLNAQGLVRRNEIPEYEVWKSMKRRCNNLNATDYRYYGGRGIKVCPEWIADFWAWFSHIGRCPIPGLTQDRIDNSRGYEPGNVCWKTMKEQCSNRRQEKITKLTDEDIDEIRGRYGIEPQADTALEFGISRSYVGNIQRGAVRNLEGLFERPPKICVVGEQNARAILTEADVSNIKGLLLHRWPGLIAELAHRYNVGHSVIWHIANGETWAHVQPSLHPIMPPSREPPIKRRQGL